MLKLVVFDDEYIVLQGLQTMIDWPRFGVELVGTAGDGYSALSLCRTHRPDIIFTDIRMPGMDGLQLIEQIMSETPESVCVVFSGFNEFEYVKRAINLGAADYLEKPLTIAKFEEGIRKAADRVMERQQVSELKLKWEEGKRQLLEKATWELLLNGAEAEYKWRDCYGEDADNIVGITVLACSAGQPVLSGHPSYRTVSVRNGAEYLSVLFHYDLTAGALWKELFSWSERAGVMIGSGRTYPLLSEAPRSYQEALRALRCRWYEEEPGWTRFEELGENATIPEGLSDREDAVIFHLRSGNKDGVLRQLRLLMDRLEAEKLDPEIAEREMLKMIYVALQVAKETGRNEFGLSHPGYSPHTEMRNLKTKEEMFRWMHGQMEMIIDAMGDDGRKSKHAAVEKALRYIEDHFHRDLSLQEVADHVQMNAAYFSMLFKEEMDITYIKHLTKVRLEKAKSLLRQGLPVYEVSQRVGYYHYRHFSEVFKKQIGITPGQYRNRS